MTAEDVEIDVDFRLGDPEPWRAMVRPALATLKPDELPPYIIVTRPKYEKADFGILVRVPRTATTRAAIAEADFTRAFAMDVPQALGIAIAELTTIARDHQRQETP